MQASGSAHWYNLWEAASHPLVKPKMHTHPREILHICTGDQCESVTEHCGKYGEKKPLGISLIFIRRIDVVVYPHGGIL